MKNLLIIISIFSLNLFSSSDCDPLIWDAAPIQAGGRVKPLRVHAYEVMKFLGKPTGKKISPVQALCLLTTSLNEPFDLNVTIGHVEIKKILEIKNSEHTISLSQLKNYSSELRAKAQSIPEKNTLKKELIKLGSLMGLYQQIRDKQNFKVFYDQKFLTLKEIQESGEASTINDVLSSSKRAYIEAKNDDYLLELTYHKANLFTWSLLLALLALFLFVLVRNPIPGMIVTGITLLLELIGVIMRVSISGRAPITNMYETVMFAGIGGLVLSLIIYWYKRDRVYIISGLGLTVLCLMMMRFANNMLSSAIEPLVPVLRDNFWLSTHVTTVILSYAALALSWMLANIALLKRRIGKLDDKEISYYADLIYSAIKYGIVLLSAGIILGGVWADYSWGRFWGWDPKETWSLIVLLIYLAILHGRYTQWISPRNFVPIISLAFLSVMMAWFGVNYILASGLHSYGFSEGGAIFLGVFFLTQIVFTLFTWKSWSSKRT